MTPEELAAADDRKTEVEEEEETEQDADMNSAVDLFEQVESDEALYRDYTAEKTGMARGKKAYGLSRTKTMLGHWGAAGGLRNYMQAQKTDWGAKIPLVLAAVLVSVVVYAVSSNGTFTQGIIEALNDPFDEAVIGVSAFFLIVTFYLVIYRFRGVRS